MKRTPIPRSIKRKLLIESGYRCAVRNCNAESTLDFHHIDGNPSNNSFDNLLVLCSNHHRKASIGGIDRKACFVIKQSLATPNILPPSPNLKRILRNELKRFFSKTKSPSRRGFLPYDRRSLFSILKDMPGTSCQLYLAIEMVGERKYRGGVDAIIGALERVGKNMPRRLEKIFMNQHKFAAIRAMSLYDNKKALNWLADLCINDKDNVFRFQCFGALLFSQKAGRYVGFKLIKREPLKGDTFECGNITTFKVRDRFYQNIIKPVGPPRKIEPEK
jgi:hypothetical protein